MMNGVAETKIVSIQDFDIHHSVFDIRYFLANRRASRLNPNNYRPALG